MLWICCSFAMPTHVSSVGMLSVSKCAVLAVGPMPFTVCDEKVAGALWFKSDTHCKWMMSSLFKVCYLLALFSCLLFSSFICGWWCALCECVNCTFHEMNGAMCKFEFQVVPRKRTWTPLNCERKHDRKLLNGLPLQTSHSNHRKYLVFHKRSIFTYRWQSRQLV